MPVASQTGGFARGVVSVVGLEVLFFGTLIVASEVLTRPIGWGQMGPSPSLVLLEFAKLAARPAPKRGQS